MIKLKNAVKMLASFSVLSLALSACSAETVEETAAPAAAGAAEEAAYDPASHIDYSGFDSASLDSAISERGFFLLQEWHDMFPADEALMREVVATLSEEPVPVDVAVTEPIRLALMFPSLEISDAFARAQKSIEGHLTALNIPFDVTEFFINSGEHEVQASQIDQLLANKDQYDYVIIGPSEYLVQKANIGRLTAVIPTIVLNVVNPFFDSPGTTTMPLSTVGFDHGEGAALLCAWTLENHGTSGNFALQRYLPGLIDSGRSTNYGDCLVEGGWTLVNEYAGDGDQEKSYTGSSAMLTANPELDLIHNGSTAGALGTLAALAQRDLMDSVLTNGWGGGQDELDSLIKGELDFTLFRVNDDWGASVAEVIKLHLEGKPVPAVIAPSMKVLDQTFTEAQIKLETDYAFRYSGVLER
jgi:autoinducer 2-binding protein LuxP